MTYVVERGALHLRADRDNQDEPGIQLVDQRVANAVGIDMSGQRYQVDPESAKQWAARHGQQLDEGWTADQLQRILDEVDRAPAIQRVNAALNDVLDTGLVDQAKLQASIGVIVDIADEGSLEDKDWALGEVCLGLLDRDTPEGRSNKPHAEHLAEAISSPSVREEIRTMVAELDRLEAANPEQAMELMMEAVGGEERYRGLDEVDGAELTVSEQGQLRGLNPDRVASPIMRGVTSEGCQFIVIKTDLGNIHWFNQRRPNDSCWISEGVSIVHPERMPIMGMRATATGYYHLKKLCAEGEVKAFSPLGGEPWTIRLGGGGGGAKSARKT